MRALPRSSRVHDVRIHFTDVLDIDLQLLAHRRQEAGQEHVGRLGKLVEECPTSLGADVEAETSLAAVWLLHDVVDRAVPARDQAHRDESSLGVACLGMFHLDDVGAPIGENCTRRWHERPCRNLEDPDS